MSRIGSLHVWSRFLGQLALIVGGVLIALALDAWWAARQERQRELAYLQQLLVDLQETESRLERTIAGDTAILKLVNSVLDRAFQGPPLPPDSLALPAGYSQFRPLTGTQVALVQGGDVRLLRSDSVRFELIAYSALLNSTETILRHTETLIWSSTERILRGRARHSRASPQLGSDGTSVWGQVDAAAAMSDPDLISALQLQATASRNRIRNLRRLEEPTASLARLIEMELDRR